MTWDATHDFAMKEAARQDIPRDDAELMWTKYNEIGAKVRAGSMTDDEGLAAFAAYSRRLAATRALRVLFSPRLDVITGKLR